MPPPWRMSDHFVHPTAVTHALPQSPCTKKPRQRLIHKSLPGQYFHGGGDRIRTDGLCDANAFLGQMQATLVIPKQGAKCCHVMVYSCIAVCLTLIPFA